MWLRFVIRFQFVAVDENIDGLFSVSLEGLFLPESSLHSAKNRVGLDGWNSFLKAIAGLREGFIFYLQKELNIHTLRKVWNDFLI